MVEVDEDTWTKHARDLYHHYDFDFAVKGGKAEFVWSKTLAAFGLLIAPSRNSPRRSAAFEEIQRAYFNQNVKRRSPRSHDPEPQAADSQRGFLLWSRAWKRTWRPSTCPRLAELNPAAALRVTADRTSASTRRSP